MAIDFPNSPTLNQEYTSGTKTWKWDGTVWNLVASGLVGPTAGSANQVVYKDSLNIASGSANMTFNGTDLSIAGKIQSTSSSGDEGGEFFLNKAFSNTSINTGITIDVYQNRLRFFEQGGSNRGAYIDITTASNGAGSDLLRPWNTAWGFVAQTTLSTSLGYINSAQDVLSLTFTSVANRRYRYTATGVIVNNASGHFQVLFTDSSNNYLREYFGNFPGSGSNYLTGLFDYTETISTSGSVTRKIRHAGSTPGVYYYGSDTRDSLAWKIRVEDIGPA